ncbi:16S rRNA (adenine(1518)-N(6)/adenine(1519)-N(6))-dimethyltransferase RsmA [Holzapfeliella sp. He02]|uniref:Ribosomal RNA small subunit methyltransferase A n=1 Tax=Holzapfeliella saturejae TaxID=3082953 RepID=A0ABU8SFF8_9LACO
MKSLPIGDPIKTSQIIHDYGLRAKKSLGQNFLTDLNVLENIVESAEITPEDQVLEVGPGIGSITQQLAETGCKVVSFEIDQRFIAVLDDVLSEYDNVVIINQDVLKVDLEKELSAYFDLTKPVKIVANLPYYITTPIMFKLLDSPLDLTSMTVLMQKEVADRIVADNGSKNWGPLSIAVQMVGDPEISFTVPPKSFNPAPKVTSAILNLRLTGDKYQDVNFDHQLFDQVVNACFKQRRKTIYNNLKQAFGSKGKSPEDIKEILNNANIPEKYRAEQLTINDFIRLTNCL